MTDNENYPPLIVECPHCHIRVIPLAGNVCPNCHQDVTDLTGVDQHQTKFTVSETEEFPSCCYSCGQYADRYIRVTSDSESLLDKLLFKNRLPEDTSNIIVHLPVCDLCLEKDVELVDADYERQTLAIMVHQRFRDRVLAYRENPPSIADEINDSL